MTVVYMGTANVGKGTIWMRACFPNGYSECCLKGDPSKWKIVAEPLVSFAPKATEARMTEHRTEYERFFNVQFKMDLDNIANGSTDMSAAHAMTPASAGGLSTRRASLRRKRVSLGGGDQDVGEEGRRAKKNKLGGGMRSETLYDGEEQDEEDEKKVAVFECGECEKVCST